MRLNRITCQFEDKELEQEFLLARWDKKDFDTDILFSQKIYTSLTKDLYDQANYEGEVSLKGRDTMTRTYSI